MQEWESLTRQILKQVTDLGYRVESRKDGRELLAVHPETGEQKEATGEDAKTIPKFRLRGKFTPKTFDRLTDRWHEFCEKRDA